MRTGLSIIGRIRWMAFIWVLLAASRTGHTQTDTASQAIQSQNPIADLISVPFQNNTNLDVGPERSRLNVLNVQPVVPVSLGPDWNVITRTILPVISEPASSPDASGTNGIGDVLFSAFFSPRSAPGWIWGVGPAVQAPTHSDSLLGNDRWGLGPTFVVLHLAASSPWVGTPEPQTASPEVIAGLYGAAERIRLMAPQPVVDAADEVIRQVIEAYSAPVKTIEDLRQSIEGRQFCNPLAAFTQACRDEPMVALHRQHR
jgi:hypothetical protein